MRYFRKNWISNGGDLTTERGCANVVYIQLYSFSGGPRELGDEQVMEFEQVITSPTPVIKSSGPEMNEPALADYQRIDQR